MTSEYPNNPPQLGGIPTLDNVNYPNTQSGNTGASSAAQDVKTSFADSAQSALNSVASHPVTQDVKNTVSNGPVGQSVKNQTAKTTSEFQNLANSRTRPQEKTATGQQLTHYHSMFYNLLSWQNPRATSIAFVVNVAAIFAARYIPILHYVTKALYLTLGATATAEIIGKLVFSAGFTSQLRPRKYYVLPKETVDQALDDVHELLNFFVIEFQRILFAENIANTLLAFFAALTAFLLIKIVPFWGLTLTATVMVYIAPFTYINNKEAIDAQLDNLTDILNKQSHQIKNVAGHHTARATESVKTYAGDYSAKAQEYLGAARQHTADVANKTANAARDTANKSANAASDTANRTANVASDTANRTANAANDTAHRTADVASDTANRTANAASDTANRTVNAANDTAHRTANAANDTANWGANAASNTANSTANAARDTANWGANAGSRNTSSSYQSSDFPNAPQTGPTPASEQFQATANELKYEAGMQNTKTDQGPVLAS